MKKIYSFLMLALVLALGSASALAQSITVSPALIEADAGGYDNILSVDFGGYDVSGYYTSVQFYGADAVTPVGSGVYSWLGAYFYQGEFNCSFGYNPGIARTAYFKVMLRDGNNYSHVVDSSNLVTVVQAGADCPAPDHLALTEGSITPHGGSFTWTGYTNEYWLNFELLTGMDNDMVSDDDQYGRILTANFDEDNIPSTLYFNGDYLGYFANRGFDWNGNEGVITYLHPIGCIQTYGTTGELELYMTSKSYPTIISFQAMLAAGGNNEASFWIDGIKVLEITSSEFQTKDWTQYSFELSPYYDHTLEWKFAKSDNDWEYDNALFLDDIIVYKYMVVDVDNENHNYDPVHCYSNSGTINSLLGIYGGETYRVFVKGVCSGYETGESDPVIFTTAVRCQKPNHLTATNMTGATADISWAGYGYDHFNLYLADEYFTEVREFSINDNSSFSLSGLSPNTTYNVWVETTCDDDNVHKGPSTRVLETLISDTLVFRTNCGVALPYFEDFENCGANNTQNSPYRALPECWNSYNETDYDFYYGYPTVQTTGYNFNGESYSGSQHLCMNSHYASNVTNTNLYAVLPAMGTVPVNTLTLSFYACHGNDSRDVPLYVGVMEDPEDIFTFEPFDTISITGKNNSVWYDEDTHIYWYHGYNQYTVDFSNYTGEGKHIAFMMEPATSDYVTQIIYIDDISCVSSVVPSSSCPIPTGLVASNVTNNSASLSWSSDNDISSYNIEYREGASISNSFFEETFDSQYLSWEQYSGLVDNILAGTSELEQNYGWTTSSNVFGYYSAKLNIYGGIYGDDDYSNKNWLVTPELQLPTDAALTFDLALTSYDNSNPASGTCEDDRFVVLVYADGQWNKLREWNNSGSSYIYNNIATTGENVFIDLTAYGNKEVKIAFYGESTENGNGDNDLHIDNVTFSITTAAGEWQSAGNTTSNATTLSNLTPGTRYEVRIQGDCDGEGTSAWSEPVTFTTIPNCPMATRIEVTQTTKNSATFSWNAGGEESAWDIYITDNANVVPDADTDPTEEYTDYNPYTAENLSPATTYYIYVRAICSETERSEWSSPATAMTKCEAMGLPYEYGFEADNEFQYCWCVLNSSTYNEVVTTNHDAHAGLRRLNLWRGSSYGDQIVILPEVQDNYDLKNYEVSFYAKMYRSHPDYVGTLHVGIMTNPNDASTFVQLGDDITTTTDYTQYSVNLGSYTGNGHYIAIKTTCVNYGAIYLDDVKVTQATPNSYTITYMDGNDVLGEQTYAFGATVTPIAEPTKEGYTFTGWDPAVPATMPAENVTVYAQWQVNSYTVTATANPAEGGSVEGAGTYDYGTEITLTATANTGYTFVEWNDGITENPRNVTVSRDSNFVANFATNAYTLTYMDGNDVLGEQTYAFGATVTPIAEPTKVGYTFTGWDPEVPATMPAEDLTVYAQWQINSYTVTATANPAEGGIVTGGDTYNYGATATLTATPNAGYTFVEWNDGITENPRNITVSRDSNFVAKFTANAYTLTYMDGNNVLDEQTYAFGATVTPIAEPTKVGYTFTGWNPEVPATMPAEDLTVYAQWQINTYTITATANPTEGGNVEGTADNDAFVSGTAYDYGTRIILIAQTNTGYQFVSWTINDSVVSTSPVLEFNVAEDMNLVANFELRSYPVTVTVNPANGGTVDGTGTYVYGQTATLTATPATGYFFANWSNIHGPISTNATYEFTVTEPIALFAYFSLNRYTITATANPIVGGTISGAGAYNHGETVTLTATPANLYEFVNWTKDGVEVTSDPTFSFTAEADGDYVANFRLATCPSPILVPPGITNITAHTTDVAWSGYTENDSYVVNYRTKAYVDGLATYFGTNLPEGWSAYAGMLDGGTADLTWNESGLYFGQRNGVFDNHLAINIYGVRQRWFISPSVILPDNASLSFDLALTAYNGTLEAPQTIGTDDKFIVLISNDNMTTWTTLREWNNSGSPYVYNNIANTATGENVDFDLGSYAGQSVYIAFYGESTETNADNDLHIDNVVIGVPVPTGQWQSVEVNTSHVTLEGLEPETEYEVRVQGICNGLGESEWSDIREFTTAPTCPVPTDLTAGSFTTHSVELGWTENGSATAWQICLNGDEENLINANTNPFTIDGLAPNTAYRTKVRAYCDDSDQSQWSDEVTFTTQCDAVTSFPWAEDFNDLSVNNSIPGCWNNDEGTTISPDERWCYTTSSNVGGYGASSGTSHDGSNCVRFNSSLNDDGNVNFLKTIPLSLPTTPMELTFWYKNPTGGDLSVYISTDRGITHETELATGLTGAANWIKHDPIDLSAYAEQEVVIVFKGTSNYGNATAFIYLDDVTVKEKPSCAIPTALNAVPDVNSAELSWTAQSGENEWSLYWKKSSETDYNEVTGITANLYTLTGLESYTAYNYYVIANCSATDASEPSFPYEFTTLCGTITSFPWTENFDELTVANSIPGCWNNDEGTTSIPQYKWCYTTSSNAGGYGASSGTSHDGSNCVRFNSSLNDDGNVNFLKTVPLSLPTTPMELTFWYKNPTGGDFSVYISTDGGSTHETALVTGLTEVPSWVKHDPIDLSAYAEQEVVIVFKGTSNDGNGNAFIYLDDVTVKEKPSCAIPTTLHAVPASNSADLSWTAQSGEGEWSIYWKKSRETDYNEVTGITTIPYTLTGLDANTTYNYYVIANCSATEASEPSLPYEFTTLCGTITTFPWSEDFESFPSSATGIAFSDPCWTNEHITGEGTRLFEVISSVGAGDNNTQLLQLPDMRVGTMTLLVLPTMDIPNSDYYFFLDVYRSDYIWSQNDLYQEEGIRVYASTDGEIEGATELAFIPRHHQVGNEIIPAEDTVGWYTYKLPVGQTGVTLIILRGESQFNAPTYMDNFVVQECNIPTTTLERTILVSELPYTWDGVVFDAAGTKDTLLIAANGCDSIVTMTLHVNSTATITATVNPAEGGSVEGTADNDAFVSGTAYDYGTTITLIAQTNTGYHFASWTINDSVVSTSPVLEFTVTEDVDLVANFELYSYTVTATANPAEGGSVEGAGSYDYGTEITLIATPATGYVFTNWTKDGVVVSSDATYTFTVEADGDYVANFATNTYTLTYMDGNDVLGEQTYAFGATVTPIAEPTKEGYTFTGWNPAVPATMPAENVTVYAQWQVNSYTVTATANPAEGGSVEGAGSYDYGTEITLTATANTGYTFVEWNDGITENPRNVTVSRDSNFVANFATNTYTLTYMDGNDVLGEQTYAFGATVTPIAEPTKDGYTFTGWNPAVPATMPAENVTVYAQWQVNSYTVTATANPAEGGTVEGAGTYNYGTTATLTATPATGYHFTNWIENGTVVNATNPYTFMVTGDRNLVANFELEKHQLTINYFYYENGTAEAAPSYIDTLYYGENYSVVSPTLQGFNPTIDTVKGVMGTEDITVRVDYLPIVYQVTFHPRGGTLLNGFTTDTVHVYGEVLWLPTATDIVREGYTFGGWYEDTNFVGNPIVAIANILPGDWDLYAKWDINTYEITATANPANGGSVEGAGTYDYGTTATLTATPATGYTFTNWTKDGVEVSTDAEYSFTVYNHGEYIANFTQMGTVATPTFSPAAGIYYDAQFVTLACATSGATIYYTTDGTVPTNASTVYQTRIDLTVGDTTVIKAIAMKEGMMNSEIATATYILLPTYTVSIAEGITNGTVTADTNRAAAGVTVTLTATPDNGYHFGTWHVTSGNEVIAVNNNSFTMPAGNVTVNATFVPNEYTITATANPTNGGSVTGAGTYDYDTDITLTATAATGYRFINWTLDDEEVSWDATYEFTVYEDANYVANFAANIYTLTYRDGDNVLGTQEYVYGAEVTPITEPTKVGYTFTGWSPDVPATMPAGNLTVYAQWQINRYTVTTTANPTEGGFVDGAGMGTYDYGTTITLTATANNGYAFVDWSDGITENPRTVTVTQDSIFVANFSRNSFRLTYMDGNNLVNEQTYAFGEAITPFTNVEKMGYTFIGWDPEVPATMPDHDVTVYAQWQINSYTVTAAANPTEGGTVEGTADNDVFVSGTAYDYGTEITLTATPAEGYLFTNWTKDGAAVSPNATYTFTVEENAEYVANFTAMGVVATPTFEPAAGTYVESQDVTIVCATEGAVIHYTTDGTTPTVESAVYSTPIALTPGDTTVIKAIAVKEGMTNSSMASATYILLTLHNITVSANPTNGGTVRGGGEYTYGETTTLTATANEGYTFVNWTLNGEEVSTDATYEFMVVADGEYVANFDIAVSVVLSASDNAICEGGEILLSANIDNPNLTNITYEWYTTDGTVETPIIGATESILMVTPSTSTNYKVYVLLNASERVASDEITITVITLEPINITLTPGDVVCDGGRITLTADIIGQGIYSWYRNAQLLPDVTLNTITDSVFTLDDDITTYNYNLIYRSEIPGCLQTASTVVTVYPSPIVTITGESVIYNNTNVVLTANVSDMIGTATYTYQWMLGNEDIASETNSTLDKYYDSNENPYIFTVKISNEATGCAAVSEPYSVYVNDTASLQPTMYEITATAIPTNGGTVTGAGTYVQGETATLTATANEGYTFVNWTLNGVEVSTDATYTFMVEADGDYVANFDIAVSVVLSASDATICEGGEVTLSANINNLHLTNISYEWYTTNGTTETQIIGATGQMLAVVPSASTTYKVYVLLNSERIASDEITITVITLEPLNLTTPSDVVCDGSSITLTADNMGEGIYSWFRNGQLIPDATLNTITDSVFTIDNDVTTYNYNVTFSSIIPGCQQTASTVVTAYPSPTVTITGESIIYNNTNVVLTANVSNVMGTATYTYQWMLGGEDIAGETNSTLDKYYDSNENPYIFTVRISNEATGCAAVSEPYYVYVNDTASLQPATYEITATAIPTNGGTVTGAGTYVQGATATLTATANTGYTFTNWTLNGVEVSTNAAYTFTVEAAGDYVANFSLNTYTLTYMDGNDVLDVATFDFGQSITPIADPTKVGYTFTGWNPAVPATMPAEDLTVFAQWQVNSYSITLNQVTGGTITVTVEGAPAGTTASTTANYNAWVQLSEETLNGYTFGNYVVTDANNTVIETPNNGFFMPASNVTVTATFTVNEYTVTYMDGNDVLDVDTFDFGQSITPIADPTKVGYTFTGWDPELPATMPAEDLTVFAQWQINSYNITATANPTNGGTVSGAGTYNHGATATLTATANTGYTFTNWTLNGVEVSTDAAYTFTVEAAGDYVANFTINSYTVTYMDDNDVLDVQTYDFGQSITPIDDPAKVGHTFTGWNPELPEFMPAEDLTVFAQWQVNSYVITVAAEPAEAGTVTGAGTYTHGATATLTATANTGFTFTNWTLNGVEVSTDATYTFTVETAGDYIANFTINSYTVTYMDGNDVLNVQTFDFGQRITPIATPTKVGYTFTGWDPELPEFMPAEDLTVFAQWQVNSYTVTYMDDNDVLDVQTYDFGQSITPIAAPEREGYTFIGWDPELPNVMPAENLTVFAQWQINSYTVTVVSNDDNMGTVTGGGTFDYGSTDTVTATAYENYTFIGWSDTETADTRVITVTRDSNLTAYFIPEETEEIEVQVNDTVMGSVELNFGGSSSENMSVNTMVEITATPEPHYHFVSWSDGNTENPRMVTLMEALNLTAIFAIDQHTITVLSADENMGTVSIGGTFDYGTEISISADALPGYEFVEWNDGNTDNPRTITVEQDSTFTAYFQLIDGINDPDMPAISIYSSDNHIVVTNAEGFPVQIFDMSGRLIVRESRITESVREYTILAPGVYLVKVGDNVVKKVTIIAK